MVILDIGKDVGAITSVTYTIKTGCDVKFNGDGCDWLDIDDKTKGLVKFIVTKANEGNERKCYITPAVGDWACDNNKFVVRQQPGEPEPFSCYRGTDNGTDYPTGGGKGNSHPILLCGNVGSHMTDSIYVSGGLQYYTGSTTPTEDSEEWKDLTETFLELVWAKLKVNKSGGCCGSGYIDIYTTKEYNTGNDTPRSTSIWLRAKDRTIQVVPDCAAIGCSGPAGKILCRQWEYEIKQCSVGYVWCGEHSTDATPIPCSEQGTCVSPRGIKGATCNCSEPPTPTCTCNITITASTLPKEGYSDFTEIGTYTTTCSGTWGTPTRKSGDPSFVDAFDISNNKIRVKVPQNAEKSRTTTYEARIGDGDCRTTFTITQDGATPTTCTCQEADVQVSEEIITLESTQGDNSFTDITYNCKPEISINDECDWLDVSLNETESRLEFTSTKANLGNERTGYTYIKGGSETCLTITVKQKQTSQCKVPTGSIHIFLDASNFHYHNPDMYRYYITNNIIGTNCERPLRDYSSGIGAPTANQPVSICHYEYSDCTFKFTYGGESYYEIASPGTECEVEAKDLSPGGTYYLYVYNTLTSSFSQQGTFKMPTTEEAQEGSLNKEIYIKI